MLLPRGGRQEVGEVNRGDEGNRHDEAEREPRAKQIRRQSRPANLGQGLLGPDVLSRIHPDPKCEVGKERGPPESRKWVERDGEQNRERGHDEKRSRHALDRVVDRFDELQGRYSGGNHRDRALDPRRLDDRERCVDRLEDDVGRRRRADPG